MPSLRNLLFFLSLPLLRAIISECDRVTRMAPFAEPSHAPKSSPQLAMSRVISPTELGSETKATYLSAVCGPAATRSLCSHLRKVYSTSTTRTVRRVRFCLAEDSKMRSPGGGTQPQPGNDSRAMLLHRGPMWSRAKIDRVHMNHVHRYDRPPGTTRPRWHA